MRYGEVVGDQKWIVSFRAWQEGYRIEKIIWEKRGMVKL
jgi:hypothetical protein